MATASDWKSAITTTRIGLGALTSDPESGVVVPAPGLGWKVTGHATLAGGRINYKQGTGFAFHAPGDSDRASVFDNECAMLAQACGLPRTRYWRRGPQVRKLGAIPAGTVVALLRDGFYYSDHSGRAHVGIFQDFILRDGERIGFRMYDQFNGGNISLRPFYFKDSYDRGLVAKKKPSSHGDYTVPVRDEAGRMMGVTVAIDDVFKTMKHNILGVGDEYYVVYGNGEQAITYLP